MPFSGNVETIPLDEVFQFIADNALEGALTVAGGGARLTIHFVEGQVFFPYSARRGTYSLGKILRQTGILSREALEKQLESVRASRAAELRELEASASPEQVEAARRRQYEEEIHDVFLWRKAYFEFAPGRPDEEIQRQRAQGKGVTLDPTAFLMEVARRADERRRIRRAIPSGRVVLEVRGGAEAKVAAQLAKKGIAAGEDGAIDGQASLEELLARWGVPHHDALAALAPLVEARHVGAVGLDVAERAFDVAIASDDMKSAARFGSHLIELGVPPVGLLALGVEKRVIGSKAFREGDEATLSARIHGVRAFALLKTLIAGHATFTLRAFSDGRERVIAASPDALALRATHDDTTQPIAKYLRRTGVLSEADLKKATAQSEKDARPIGDVLLRGGFVTHEDWSAAALEKIADEVAAVALAPEVDMELANRFRDESNAPPGAGPKKEAAQAIALSIPLDDALAKKLVELVAKWQNVIHDVPGEDPIFVPGERHGDGDPAGKFFGRFDGKRSVGVLRRVAKAEPLEFLKFVQGGVKRGYVRAPDRDELEQTLQEALDRGDDARAHRIASAAVAFGCGDPFAARVRELKARDAAPSLDTRPSIEGDMEGVGLAAVLQGLRGGKRTGTLAITDAKRESKLYFHRGCVFLLKLQDKEAQEFVEFFLEGDEGQVAPSLGGAVDESSMDVVEARKLKDEVLDVLFWENAKFTFRKNELPEDFHTPPEGASKVALDTDKFLIEAIRRIEEWDQIRRILPSGKVVLAFTSPGAKHEAIRAGVSMEVLTIVDGRHSLDDIVRISGTPRLEVARFLRERVEKGELAIVESKPAPAAS